MPHCPISHLHFSGNWFNHMFYSEQIFNKKENRKEITFVRTRQLHTPFQVTQHLVKYALLVKRTLDFKEAVTGLN